VVLDMALWKREPFPPNCISLLTMQSRQTPDNVPTTYMVVCMTRKNICPCDQILEDLKEQVALQQMEGDMVIILADINKEI